MTLSSIGLQLWLAKRFNPGRLGKFSLADARHYMRQNYMDYEPRGKGNKAWNRLDRMQKADAWGTVTIWTFNP
jgi:hypothetical protein